MVTIVLLFVFFSVVNQGYCPNTKTPKTHGSTLIYSLTHAPSAHCTHPAAHCCTPIIAHHGFRALLICQLGSIESALRRIPAFTRTMWTTTSHSTALHTVAASTNAGTRQGTRHRLAPSRAVKSTTPSFPALGGVALRELDGLRTDVQPNLNDMNLRSVEEVCHIHHTGVLTHTRPSHTQPSHPHRCRTSAGGGWMMKTLMSTRWTQMGCHWSTMRKHCARMILDGLVLVMVGIGYRWFIMGGTYVDTHTVVVVDDASLSFSFSLSLCLSFFLHHIPISAAGTGRGAQQSLQADGHPLWASPHHGLHDLPTHFCRDDCRIPSLRQHWRVMLWRIFNDWVPPL